RDLDLRRDAATDTRQLHPARLHRDGADGRTHNRPVVGIFRRRQGDRRHSPEQLHNVDHHHHAYAHAYAYAYSNVYGYGNSDSNATTNSHIHANANPNGDSNCDVNSNSNGHGNRDSDLNAYSN